MKISYILTLALSLIGSVVFADVTNPVSDYKTRYGLTSNDTLYRWELDINGDGKNEVLLTSEEAYSDEVKEGAPTWSVYIAKQDGSGYVLSKGIDEDGVIGPAVPQIDPEKFYLGTITQLGKRGIVTMQVFHLRKDGDVAYIYAYTIEGDHLKKTLLAKYDPKKGNPIYDQYLSESKRTKAQWQQVKS